MKLLILLSCLVAATVAIKLPARPTYDLAKAQEYFQNFIVKYKKHYDDRNDEKEKRFQNFKANLKIINGLNQLSKAVFGITKFTDLSSAEFEEKYSSCSGGDIDTSRRDACTVVTDEELAAVDPPADLDFRNRDCVTSVKDQGACKSCWAFTTIGVLEGVYRIRHNELLTLSAMQLMSCLPSSGNCTNHGNFMRNALEDLTDTDGVMLDSDYAYVAEDAECRYDKDEARVKVASCTYYNLEHEDNFRRAMYQRGPVGITYNGTAVQHYIGGIVTAEECPASTNHASVLVGYGSEDGQDYWLIKNSWGADWGEEGYLRIARGGNACGIHSRHVVSARVE